MQQIVDLQRDQRLTDLGVALVSLGIDPLPRMTTAARQWELNTPLLSDQDSKVSRAYGVLQWAMANGEPGHTFVLVDKDGQVIWIKDYGAPENSGRMYIPLDELYPEIQNALVTNR
jgi:peroxiredoxin